MPTVGLDTNLLACRWATSMMDCNQEVMDATWIEVMGADHPRPESEYPDQPYHLQERRRCPRIVSPCMITLGHGLDLDHALTSSAARPARECVPHKAYHRQSESEKRSTTGGSHRRYGFRCRQADQGFARSWHWSIRKACCCTGSHQQPDPTVIRRRDGGLRAAAPTLSSLFPLRDNLDRGDSAGSGLRGLSRTCPGRHTCSDVAGHRSSSRS